VKQRGEVFVDHWDANNGQPISLTLGDDRLPYGLWKSIEHMRKGEKARIMVKPKWGYNSDENRDIVFFPRGWTEGEKKKMLMSRRVFFEVKLVDWIVRHDINGDGLLVKTIHERGAGFERVSKHDEITLDLKIYQREQVFFEKTDLFTPVKDTRVIPATLRTILESMKQGEKVTCLVQPAHFIHYDKDLRGKPKEEGGYPEIDEDKIL